MIVILVLTLLLALSAAWNTSADNPTPWSGDVTRVRATVPDSSKVYLPLVQKSSGASQAIIIDHTNANIGQVPEYWINQVKALLKLSYGHT